METIYVKEQWDAYDIHREKTGEILERGQKVPEGRYHMVVQVIVFNSKNQMLIQQRQSFKDGWPDMWDVTSGGSAKLGESSQQAAMREVFEEVGISVNLEGVRPHLSSYFPNGFTDVYLVIKDIDEKNLNLQYEEVQAVKWASMEEIFSMIDDQTFVNYHHSWIQLLFDIKEQYSVFNLEIGRYGQNGK